MLAILILKVSLGFLGSYFTVRYAIHINSILLCGKGFFHGVLKQQMHPLDDSEREKEF